MSQPKNSTTASSAQQPRRSLQEIAHDALEVLEVARRSLSQLEALLYETSEHKSLSPHVRTLLELGWSVAADAANLACCNCEAIGESLSSCAPQNSETENVARDSEVQP